VHSSLGPLVAESAGPSSAPARPGSGRLIGAAAIELTRRDLDEIAAAIWDSKAGTGPSRFRRSRALSATWRDHCQDILLWIQKLESTHGDDSHFQAPDGQLFTVIWPSRSTPRAAAIVVIQEWWGLNDQIPRGR